MTTMEHLPITWDGGLIAISYLVSVFASYTTLGILQLRFNSAIVVLGAFNLSVSGIWSMHFIGMAAYSVPAELSYNIWWTLFSAVCAFACASLGLLLLTRRLLSAEHAVMHPNTLEGNLDAMKTAPHGTLLLSAVCVALGVCVMHYVGMHSVESATAQPVMQWGVIIASCLIALFAATAALYFALILPVTMAFTPLTALVMGVAVCGMHYTGMHGITYEADASVGSVAPKSSLDGVVPYIVCGSMCVTAFVQALASHMYRTRLRSAVETTELMAALIAKARFDELGQMEASQDEGEFEMAEVVALQDAFSLMRTELIRVIPQSVLVHSDGDGADEVVADEDELTSEEEGSSKKSSESDWRSSIASHSRSSAFSTPVSRTAVRKRRERFAEESRTAGSALVTKEVCIVSFNLVGFQQVLAGSEKSLADIQKTYLSTIARIVCDYKGVVDSFNGDRVFASFNAVRRAANQRKLGVGAALEVAKALSSEKDIPPLSVGVACGMALCGNTGTSEMTRFNVMGSVYSQALSLERLAAQQLLAVNRLLVGTPDSLKHRILCSESIQPFIEHSFYCECCDVVRFPGAPGASPCTTILSIEGERVAVRHEEWMYELQRSEASNPHADIKDVFAALVAGEIDSARDRLETCTLDDVAQSPTPSRKISLFHAERLLRALESGIPMTEAAVYLGLPPLSMK